MDSQASVLDIFAVPDGPPMDSVPAADDIEYPCARCGREIIYAGRGRKPGPKSLCTECKPRKGSTVKLTGNANNLAAQAAKTLVQLNTMIGVGAAAVGFYRTSGEIIAYQDTFEGQAYAALSTDPALCKAILSTAGKTGKASLVMAYIGQFIAISATATEEYKMKKAEREAKREATE
jgi:hypothetical protein